MMDAEPANIGIADEVRKKSGNDGTVAGSEA